MSMMSTFRLHTNVRPTHDVNTLCVAYS